MESALRVKCREYGFITVGASEAVAHAVVVVVVAQVVGGDGGHVHIAVNAPGVTGVAHDDCGGAGGGVVVGSGQLPCFFDRERGRYAADGHGLLEVKSKFDVQALKNGGIDRQDGGGFRGRGGLCGGVAHGVLLSALSGGRWCVW